jgi:hypothetical protein
MFISALNKDQQAILLSLSKRLISADGIILKEEQVLYDSIAAQCESEIELKDVALCEISSKFTTQQAKVSLLLELLGVAHADNNYHESERGIIKSVTEVLDIEPRLLEDMEAWVKRQFILMKEARIFMEES